MEESAALYQGSSIVKFVMLIFPLKLFNQPPRNVISDRYSVFSQTTFAKRIGITRRELYLPYGGTRTHKIKREKWSLWFGFNDSNFTERS